MKHVNLSKTKRLGFAVSNGLHPSDVWIHLCLFSDTRMCSSGRRQLKDKKLENLGVLFVLLCSELDTKLMCIYSHGFIER